MNAHIVIVGAGPTGLAAATELARAGHQVEIVEAKEQPKRHSRALGINARTLDLLEPSGVTADLLALGTRMPELHLNVPGKAPIVAQFRQLHHRFNFLLTLAQSDTEALLTKAALAAGVTISRATTLVALHEHPQHVTVHVRTAGTECELQATHVLGADGGRSVVRHQLGLAMPGRTLTPPWTLADIEAEWPYAWQTLQVFLRPDHVLLAFPFVHQGVHLVRLVASSGPVLDQLPEGVQVRRVHWQSQFTIHERLAHSFGAGRIFLAGDAAHLHSPVGARGMNMGIEDGLTFAHKLIQGELPSYARERRKYAGHVVRLTSLQTRILSTGSRLVAQLRDVALRSALHISTLEQRLLREFSGLNSTSR